MKHNPIISIIAIALGVLSLSACMRDNLIPENFDNSDNSITSLKLSATTLSLQPGERTTLVATVSPDLTTPPIITWSSSRESIAKVSSDGEVTAMSPGHCKITAMCNGKTDTCEVTVSIPVSAITLNYKTVSLYVGESLKLTASVWPVNASNASVVWFSSDTDIVSISGGVITALAAGMATVTASAGEYSVSCPIIVLPPFSYGGMCLESVSAWGGTIEILNPNQLTIDYRIDNQPWTSVSTPMITIKAKAGQHVWFRGMNQSYARGNSEDGYYPTVFNCYDGEFYLYGNLMSLIYGDEYDSNNVIPGEFAFFKLFSQNSNIVNHPSLDIELPATTLSASCYRNMFYSCAKLTRAPKLPAKKLEEACYASMFCYCSSLKEAPVMAAEEMAYMSCTWMMMRTGIEQAPELPAMNLARSCYEFMFMECPNLKKGPSVLPATELAATCYTGMFQRCEKLEDAPMLPATEMKYNSYSHMFNGCKSLKKAPELPATSLAQACYSRMFGNSGLVEAPELPAMDLEVMCYQYMFEGCTSLEKAPVLPALNLNYWCYEKMFNGCSNLKYIKMMATKAMVDTWSGYKLVDLTSDRMSSYCTEWVDGVSNSGTFVRNPEATWDLRGVNGIPEGWTIE